MFDHCFFSHFFQLLSLFEVYARLPYQKPLATHFTLSPDYESVTHWLECGPGRRGGGRTDIKGRQCSSQCRKLQKRFLESLRVLSSKYSTARDIAVPLRELSRKNMIEDNALFWNCYLLGLEKISSQINQTGSWLFLGIIFKVSHE